MSQRDSSTAVVDDPDVTIHHRSRRAGRDKRPAKITLNLTAMIDVIFLLLVFFVVTASFTPGEGIITAKLPQGTGTGPTVKLPPQPLYIVVAPMGSTGFRLGIEGHQAPRDFRELAKKLVSVQYHPSVNPGGTHKPDDPVIIRPHRNVRWQHVVNAFNATVRARYTNIAFAQAD